MALRYALLGALADQPRTGYALLKHFEQSFAYAWPASHSQIYPELARLLEDGLIEQTGSGARNSKTYSVTDRGLADIPDHPDAGVTHPLATKAENGAARKFLKEGAGHFGAIHVTGGFSSDH